MVPFKTDHYQLNGRGGGFFCSLALAGGFAVADLNV